MTLLHYEQVAPTALLTLNVPDHFYKQVAPTALNFFIQMGYYKQFASTAFISLMGAGLFGKKIKN